MAYINDVKTDPGWRENMLEVELAVNNQSPYRDIAKLFSITGSWKNNRQIFVYEWIFDLVGEN